MPGVLKKPFGAALTIAIAIIGATVAGAILFTSSRANDVDLTTARLVPADAGFYFAFNTDLTSEQWVATFNLLERLGNEDPEGELRGDAEESGIDWENDVAPFLGGNAAIYVRAIDVMNLDFSASIILQAKDASRVMQVIEEQADVWDEHAYGGVEYLELGIMGYAARLDDHVVIAYDEASLFEVIDVHTGNTPALASVDDFQRLRDELTKNFMVFMYMSSESLLGDFWLNDPVVRSALAESGADLALKPAALVLGANKAGFEFQAASVGEGGMASPMLAPRESRFASLVPGSTAAFFSTTGVAQAWEVAVVQARDEIDDAIADGSGGEFRSLDEALREAGEELGINSLEDVIQLFHGEMAVAVWFPTGDEDAPEGAFLAEVQESDARPILEALVRKNGAGEPETRQVGGVEVTVAVDEDGEPLAYAFKDDYVVVGTIAGVEGILLLGNEAPLSSEDRYRETVDAMPTGLGSYMYLNMATVLRLASADMLPVLDEAEKAMRGLILNAVDERGVVRASGILTIGD